MRSSKGFSLVEVIIAVMLLGIGVTFVAFMAGSFKETNRSQADTVGINLARTYIDTVRAAWTQNNGDKINPSLTAYPGAVLPRVTEVPLPSDSYDYEVIVTPPGSTINSFAACTGANCIARYRTLDDTGMTNGTAAVLEAPLRRVLIIVTDDKGTKTQLSTIITREDLPCVPTGVCS